MAPGVNNSNLFPLNWLTAQAGAIGRGGAAIPQVGAGFAPPTSEFLPASENTLSFQQAVGKFGQVNGASATSDPTFQGVIAGASPSNNPFVGISNPDLQNVYTAQNGREGYSRTLGIA